MGSILGVAFRDEGFTLLLVALLLDLCLANGAQLSLLKGEGGAQLGNPAPLCLRSGLLSSYQPALSTVGHAKPSGSDQSRLDSDPPTADGAIGHRHCRGAPQPADPVGQALAGRGQPGGREGASRPECVPSAAD